MDASWLNGLPGDKVLLASYRIGSKEDRRVRKNVLGIYRAIPLIHTRGIIIDSRQGSGPGKDRERCNGQVRDRLELITPMIAGRLMGTYSNNLT